MGETGMTSEVPLFATFIIVALSVGVPALFWMTLTKASTSGKLAPDKAKRIRLASAVGLAVWLLVIYAMALKGVFEYQEGDSYPRFAPAVLFPILLGAALLFSQSYRRLVDAMPQHWIIGSHGVRLLGFIFLILISRKLLPASFAHVAYGDMLTGFLALFTAYVCFTNKSYARPATLLWNLVGLADAASASTEIIRTYPNFNATEPTSAAVGAFPLVLLIGLGVPTLVVLHVYSVYQWLTKPAV